MLQEANNFYLGSNIVSRLYMGDTLVWPFPSGDLWQFFDNPFGKTLSNLNITYSNGNIISDWGDGSTSEIVSTVNYTHTFGGTPDPPPPPPPPCSECGGSATLVGVGGGTVCIGVPNANFNSSDIVPDGFDCNYTINSYMQYPTSSCGAAMLGSYLSDPSRCGSLANIGKPYYKAILAGGGERTITPGLTFAQCGIGQGLHTYYVILCVNSCASSAGAIKTKSYPSQLWIN